MSTHLEETLFLAARELRDASARAAFLAQACDDDALRARIVARLQADPLAVTRLVASTEVTRSPPLEKAGDTIGRYKLLQQIGQGGCGVVYMAEQSEPVRRKVALKVIKLGMDTRNVIARFEAERQALAMMDHPNIARVLDGGATATGRPYFVMELVRGIPITKYCDENNLPASQRLDLFITVCHAIQHAHQKGIIHRDIKPSNILVTMHDGVPVPKVIDFGVAKATETRLTDLTLFTELHAFIGTPAYMSPEQAEMSSLDIDTRADIYSLGVLLYELLSGRLPFDPKELLKAGLEEMRRTIREVEPPHPSTRLGTLTDAERAAIAKQRGVAPEQLSTLLRGDLDWIVMKTLEKDRTRRYDTANALAHDLQRYLGNEPVLARPPSTAYLLRKLVRRHRTAFAAGSVVVVALVAGIAVSSWQAVRARHAEWTAAEERTKAVIERDRARQAEQKAEDEQQLAEHNLYAANMNMAQSAWEENNLSRLRSILEDTRTYPDRSFEWYYWQRQAHLDLRTLRGHTLGIKSVAFSPDGRRIVTGSDDYTARVWEVETGREMLSLKGHVDPVNSAAFSPDGRRIVTASEDKTAKLWDAETGRELLTFKGHTLGITSVAFSSDGRRIATASTDETARTWDAETGRELLAIKFKRTSDLSPSVTFSPDDQRILTGSGDTTAEVWDAETGHELLALKGGGYIASVAFSADGQRILTNSIGGDAMVWDAKTGRVMLTLRGHTGEVESVAFSPDGRRIVTGSDDKTAKLWDAETGRELLTFKGHALGITSVAFSRDGRRIVTGSGDKTAKVWDAETNRECLILNLQGTRDLAKSGAFSPEVTFSPDGRRIATSSPSYDDDTAKTWDADTGKELLTFKGHDASVNAVAFSPDGRQIVTGSDDQTAKVWDAATGREVLTLKGIGGAVTTVGFASDGRRVFAGSLFFSGNGSAKVWDAVTGHELLSFTGGEKRGYFAGFSPDMRRIVTVRGYELNPTEEEDFISPIKVWNSDTGRELFALKVPTRWGLPVAFSPDGRRIVTVGIDDNARVWNAETGRELLILKGHKDSFNKIAFSSDGRRIVTGGDDHNDHTVKVWDAETGREMLTLAGHDYIGSVAFSPDGRRILAGGYDDTLMMRIAATPEEVEAWRNEELEAQRKENEAAEQDRKEVAHYEAIGNDLDSAIAKRDWDKATAALAAAEKLPPREERFRDLEASRFEILIGKKEYEAAYQLMEKLSDTTAYRYQADLAQTIIKIDGIDPRYLILAEKLAIRANETSKGTDPDDLEILARVLFMDGKKEEAIKFQDQAMALANRREKPRYQSTLDSYRQGILPKPEPK